MKFLSIDEAVNALKEGEIIIYPTEAVYGLGCDPENVQACMKLRAFKQRHDKGFILVAAVFEQIIKWVDWSKMTKMQVKRIQHSWPGHVTWILPASRMAAPLVLGPRHTVAIRVSQHSGVQRLCKAFAGPIVSTSANGPGMPPAGSLTELESIISNGAAVGILEGDLGKNAKPSKVIDAMSNKVIRP